MSVSYAAQLLLYAVSGLVRSGIANHLPALRQHPGHAYKQCPPWKKNGKNGRSTALLLFHRCPLPNNSSKFIYFDLGCIIVLDFVTTLASKRARSSLQGFHFWMQEKRSDCDQQKYLVTGLLPASGGSRSEVPPWSNTPCIADEAGKTKTLPILLHRHMSIVTRMIPAPLSNQMANTKVCCWKCTPVFVIRSCHRLSSADVHRRIEACLW